MATTVDKDSGNSGGSIVESFIKSRSSTMFVHPLYSMDGLGNPIEISGPHEEFLNSAIGIWISGNIFQMVDLYQ